MPAVPSLSARDQNAYLQRLGIEPELLAGMCLDGPTSDALLLLHRSHLDHVPFENLNIHLGVSIDLDPAAIVAKIVDRRRGGFCYELNTAFASLLVTLGFEVSLLEARVYADGVLGVPFDHLCLLVTVPEPGGQDGHERSGPRFLVDVGFGDSFLDPIRFELDTDHVDGAGTFRVCGLGDQWFDLMRDGVPTYRFSTVPRALVDFTPGCVFHQTSQDTPFTRRPICTRRLPDGRATLRGSTLVTTVGGSRTEVTVDALQLREVYRADFGVELTESDVDLLTASSGQGAVLFDSAVGRCGVGWRENRIVAVALPEHNDEATLARVAVPEGDLDCGALGPPVFVQRGIEAMVGLLAGSRHQLDDVLVDLTGVPAFDAQVYALARTIPVGEVLTYGAVAKRLGQPGGAQAVGGALGRNPVPIVVPCHRVIAADGNLGGFSAGGGAATKRKMLEIEGAPINRQLF